MINYDLLALLERVLGKGRKTSGTNYAFFSPFVSHHKPKLEIDVEMNDTGNNVWHCWVSDAKGPAVITLFRKMSVSNDVYTELKTIINTKSIYSPTRKKIKVSTELQLPDEFIPITRYAKIQDFDTKMQLRRAISYLVKRGVTTVDIQRYNIGYCAGGIYDGRIVIPSYDANFKLNFFTSRYITSNAAYPYKNPDASKNIVGFESLINWNNPITLVEGVFDAITARYNAIPLFGKTLQSVLKYRLISRKPPKVYVALDPDAIKNAINICDTLISNGLVTSMIKLDDKDISDCGFPKFRTYVDSASIANSFDIIKDRIIYGRSRNVTFR